MHQPPPGDRISETRRLEQGIVYRNLCEDLLKSHLTQLGRLTGPCIVVAMVLAER